MRASVIRYSRPSPTVVLRPETMPWLASLPKSYGKPTITTASPTRRPRVAPGQRRLAAQRRLVDSQHRKLRVLIRGDYRCRDRTLAIEYERRARAATWLRVVALGIELEKFVHWGASRSRARLLLDLDGDHRGQQRCEHVGAACNGLRDHGLTHREQKRDQRERVPMHFPRGFRVHTTSPRLHERMTLQSSGIRPTPRNRKPC
jgi:hypothetical protein